MRARSALVFALAGLFTAPHAARARPDDRVFDPYYWAHPHFIDPAFGDAGALPKHRALDREAERLPERAEHGGERILGHLERDEGDVEEREPRLDITAPLGAS